VRLAVLVEIVGIGAAAAFRDSYAMRLGLIGVVSFVAYKTANELVSINRILNV
jgi:hypothetical protein